MIKNKQKTFTLFSFFSITFSIDNDFSTVFLFLFLKSLIINSLHNFLLRLFSLFLLSLLHLSHKVYRSLLKAFVTKCLTLIFAFADFTEAPEADFDVASLMRMLTTSDINWPAGGGVESK